MKISEIFNLHTSQIELDFVDVDLDRDCALYIDPFLIANSNSQWAIQADKVIKSFFSEFKTAMINKDYEKAEQLFIFMSEPKENCLGVSKLGTTNGRGVGKLNTQKILNRIIESNAIVNGLVNNIEDIIVFVEDIDRDKLSDMVTNIIRKKLIDYTQNQCHLWGIPLTRGETLPYWEPVKQQWVYSDSELLIVDDREIVLIPKSIVSPINIYEASKYKWYFIVEQERNFHLQRRSSLVKVKALKSGKFKYYLPKVDVNEDIGHQIRRGDFANTKDYIRKYTQQYPELFVDFINRAKKIAKPLSNQQISKQISTLDVDDIIDGLIARLRAIPAGKDFASDYHHYVKSLLEILFYPFLINPVIEREIHDGRKRIDIVMDNNADAGFFYNLHNIAKIYCPYVYVECKNYGKDVANPELDQLSGRFSSSRGQFGILVCRDIENEQLFIKRCQDTYKDGRGLIIHLTDKDIIKMFELIKDNKDRDVWALFDNRKREITLS